MGITFENLTEEELCDLLEISRPTVRQAYNKLENDGYLTMYDLKVIFQVKSF